MCPLVQLPFSIVRHFIICQGTTNTQKSTPKKERAVMESTMTTTLNLWRAAIDHWQSGTGAGICELWGRWGGLDTLCFFFWTHLCLCHSVSLQLCTPLGKECLFGCCIGSCHPFKTVQLAHEVPFSIPIWIMTLETLVVAQHRTRLFPLGGSVHVRERVKVVSW